MADGKSHKLSDTSSILVPAITCSKCKETKEPYDFSRKGAGYRGICKSCHNSYVRTVWYPQNKQKQIKASTKYKKAHKLKYKAYTYKVPESELVDLFSNPICKICGSVENIVIDHCHTSNKVRGLLCSNCNKGLGFFKDNILLLQKAIEYLV